MATRLRGWLLQLLKDIRELSGDDAYERYLAHHAAMHCNGNPLSEKDYFILRERGKWEGVRRCC